MDDGRGGVWNFFVDGRLCCFLVAVVLTHPASKGGVASRGGRPRLLFYILNRACLCNSTPVEVFDKCTKNHHAFPVLRCTTILPADSPLTPCSDPDYLCRRRSSMLTSIAAATAATPRTAVAPEPSSSAGSASPTVTAAAAPVGAATTAAVGAPSAPLQAPAIPAAVHRATTAAAAIQPIPSPSASSLQSSPGAAATATAVLSGCSFRPARPQSDPAVPWADGRSETEASPFLFVLDGGTVELVSPVFEAAGQAFVAQVRGCFCFFFGFLSCFLFPCISFFRGNYHASLTG